MELEQDLQSRQEVRNLVEAADLAQGKLRELTQQELDRIAEAISEAGTKYARELAELACEETGFGNAADKREKNLFAAQRLWAHIRDMKTVGILRRDPEKKLWEIGVPVGVIGAITPSTNPTSTVIYKAMIALKSGNAIVFSPHPGAKRCTMAAARRMAEAAELAGCPSGAIGCISLPTMDAVRELMHHPKVKLILATGGGAMVRAAYSSGTPAIGVGAGNGPAYLHSSCQVKQAVEQIIRSKTFDYGTVCASEQSIIVERDMEKPVLEELSRQGGCLLSEEEGKKLAKFLFRANGTMNPAVVGKSASTIAEMAGLGEKARRAKILLARETDAGTAFPYSMEKLCPVLGFFVVEHQDDALELACRILEHEGQGHTFSMHCRDESVIARFALRVPVSRFLVNTPAALGGIGLTTGLFPALTLGCGAAGGSSSSNNIGPMDLINLRRVAWNLEESSGQKTDQEDLIDRLAERLLKQLRYQEKETVK